MSRRCAIGAVALAGQGGQSTQDMNGGDGAILRWLRRMFRGVQVGDYVISVGRIFGGTSGRVVRTRRALGLQAVLVAHDGGRYTRGRQLWHLGGTLAVIDEPPPRDAEA